MAGGGSAGKGGMEEEEEVAQSGGEKVQQHSDFGECWRILAPCSR